MSDVFKWIFATILHYALITSPMLMAQETASNLSSSVEQPETKAADGPENPQPVAVAQESSSAATEPDRQSARPTLAELMQEFRSLEEFATQLRVIEQQSVTFDSEKTQVAFGMERVGQLHRVDREFVTRGNNHETTVLEYNIDGQPIGAASSFSKANLMIVAGGKLPMSDASSLPLQFGGKKFNPASVSELFQQHPGYFALDWANDQAIISLASADDVVGLKAQFRMGQDGEGRWVPVQYAYEIAKEEFHFHWELQNFDNLAKWYNLDYKPKGYCKFVWGDVRKRETFLRTDFEVQKRTALYPVADGGRTDAGDAETQTELSQRVTATQRDQVSESRIHGVAPEPQNPFTIFHLLHTQSDHVAKQIQLLYPGKAEAIVADERINSLMVRGDAALIREIEQLLKILDANGSSAGKGHGSGKVPAATNPFATKRGGSGSPFAGRGSGGSRSTAESLPSNDPTITVDEDQLKIFHLQHSDANLTAAVIEQLFGGAIVKVAVDARTNSLIVRSNGSLLQQIEAILLRLDEQPGMQTPIVSSTSDTTANSTIPITPDSISSSEPPIVPIAEYRRRLNELELPLLQLAEKVRSTEASLGKDHPGSVKQRADLRALVQQTFAARQEIQRAELAEFTRRLKRMQQSIDARDRIADKIIERRMEGLLSTRPAQDSEVKESSKSRLLKSKDGAGESTKSTQRFKRTSVTAKVTGADSSSRFFDEQPVLYGFPLDKTNRAILVLRAKLSEDDLISIDVDLGDFVFPAKVIASNRTTKLLLVQVSADVTFDSVPLATEHIKTHQRIQLGGHGGFVEEVVVADVKPDPNMCESQQIVTDAPFGISNTSLILNHDGTQLLGLGIGDNTIIPAPEISKWLNATMSKIGVQPTSD